MRNTHRLLSRRLSYHRNLSGDRCAQLTRTAAIGFLALFVPACASTSSDTPAPVEVTRFSAQSGIAPAVHGTVFIETAPNQSASPLELAPYKAAVAQELAALGYREAPRAEADQVVQVSIEQNMRAPSPQRNPVNVGLGGSAGSYGSNLGVGVGINLGDLFAGRPQEMVDTRLAVMIRDKASGQSVWEGRADVSERLSHAQSAQGASRIVRALFSDFPGESGQTVVVR